MILFYCAAHAKTYFIMNFYRNVVPCRSKISVVVLVQREYYLLSVKIRMRVRNLIT